MLKILKRILPYYKKYRVQLIFGILIGVTVAVLNVFIPKYIKEISNIIYDDISTGTAIDLATVWYNAIVSVIVILVGSLLKFLHTIALSNVSKGLTKDIRSAASDKIDRIPLSFYDSSSTGDILSRVTDEVAVFSNAISSKLFEIFSAGVMITVCIVAMFASNALLAICVIVSTFAGSVVNYSIMKKARKASKSSRKLLGDINGYIEEAFAGHLIIKAFNCEEEVLEHFKQNNDAMYKSVRKSNFYQNIMPVIMTFIGNLAYVTVSVTGAYLMIKGRTDIGTLVAFILYVKMFSSPVSQIARNIGALQHSLACAERVLEFLESEEMADPPGGSLMVDFTPAHSGSDSLSSVKGRIVFNHVRFGYLPNQIVLQDFSASVEPGMKVAIVGPTGSGKSTLVNLLMRFYELNDGNIYIDGTPLRAIPRGELHNMIAMVLQDPWCFNGSLRENIVYSTEGVTDERLNEVIDKVHLSFFVDSLPNGVDTVIDEQNPVSEGQKQLISIARAMLRNSPIMILDEATSSVDTRTEIYIQKALDELARGRTSFVIAHRLSTVQNADIIFVLKDGDIVEIGTHDELLKKAGFYSELYNSQFSSV